MHFVLIEKKEAINKKKLVYENKEKKMMKERSGK